MGHKSHSVDDAIERLHRERESGDRYVDLAIDFVDGDHLLYSAGGRWDRRLDDFDGEAAGSVVVRVHPGQRSAVEWFARWMDAHAERRETPPPPPDFETFVLDTDPEHVYSALFAGGRRAGKTWVAVAMAVCYGIMFPGSIVWLVSPADTKHEEIRRYVAQHVAGEWVDHETVADGWELCNGSVLLLKSAFDPEALKEGKANFIVLNEGQKMKERAFVVARGAIVDASGCVLVCANPPTERKDHTWVADFAAEARAGKRAAVYLQFNPLLNPHIDRNSLLALSGDVDQRTFEIEVLGMFLGPKDAVAYNWVRFENERKPGPELLDVTELFLATCEGPGITDVAGLDVQRIPYIGGPIYRFYLPPGRAPTRENVFAWIVGEIVLEGGDEVDYCGALLEAGYSPATTLIVCDASGQYQHSRRRNTDQKPPEWTGRGSFSIIRGEGFTRIVPPDRRQKRNPQIVDRIRAFTSMISNRNGVRRLFADPDAAPESCKAIREWKTVHGAASRAQDVAHLGDGISYPMIRLFPRHLRSGPRSGNPRPVSDPVAARVDLVVAPPATPAEQRITPSMRGPSHMRRGLRTRGL